MTSTSEINEEELRGFIQRVGERWPLEKAFLGGARAAEARGAEPQAEQQTGGHAHVRDADFIVVLCSEAFEETPWLERAYRATGLWDAEAMGDRPQMHCYTASQLKRTAMRLDRVKETIEEGIDLLPGPATPVVEVRQAGPRRTRPPGTPGTPGTPG